MKKAPVTDPRLRNISILAKLMDSQFRIPGTNFRFGLDAVIGLIPGIGDLSTFAVSGYMLVLMARNGASGYVIARMALNIVIDTLFGSIPVIGDIFDAWFKANQKNLRLMERHYVDGRYQGGAWKVIVPVLIIVLALIAGIIYGTYRLFQAIFQ